jgi:predicted enzyme related to lactoylglutathione lyase
VLVSDTNPRLFRLLLEVSNLEAAVAFYASLLGVSGRTVRGGRHYFDCGGVIVGLVDVSAADRPVRPMSEYLYFAVSDLEAVFERATSLGCLASEQVHGAAAGEIVVRPWGERSFYAADAYGNRLCFVDDSTLFVG